MGILFIPRCLNQSLADPYRTVRVAAYSFAVARAPNDNVIAEDVTHLRHGFLHSFLHGFLSLTLADLEQTITDGTRDAGQIPYSAATFLLKCHP